MKSTVMVVMLGMFLLAAVVPAIGASQADLLVQGIADLHDKDPAKQAQGVSCLDEVIRNAPNSPEAGIACYQLGCYYRLDREKSLVYFRQGYGIQSKDQSNAGISVGHTLAALGKKLEAADAFEDVGNKFPDKASYAYYRAGMNYLGESRGKLQSAALRSRAKELFTKSVAAGNIEAKIHILGMRWEDCYNGNAKWEELIPDLEEYANDPKPPAYARARAFLMIAEHSQEIRDAGNALTYTDKVLETEFKGCRAEQAWAMRVKADALGELGRWNEAVAVYSDIYSQFTDKDNFGGNNVRAISLYYKAQALEKLGLNDESVAVMNMLHQEYPDTIYARAGGLK